MHFRFFAGFEKKAKVWRVVVLGIMLASATMAPAQSNQYRQLYPDVIEQRLRQYQGSNPVRAATLRKLFREAECDGDRLKEQPVLKSVPNVICTMPGTGDDIIVVGAHFDHVSSSEGVVDNWSGASLLPSLYESLSSIARRHTFVFIGFTDEEKGFIGSQTYLSELTKEEIGRIRAMVNIDTLGLGPTEIWISNSDPKLVKDFLAVAAAMKLPVKGMNVDGVGDSDGRSFKKHKIPSITLHSVTNDSLGILHSSKDNFSVVNLKDYYDSYKLITAYLVLLDSTLSQK
jgi:hypothetical protein